MVTTIPKIIHYCWFGRNPLPKSAQKCIASWRKFFPDYEIREWNEDNFDVNIIPYTREAYEMKKYAFVSDYARFWILYHHGGLYFDTDVEVIRPMDDIIERGPFMGCEIDGEATAGLQPAGAPRRGGGGPPAAPGLGLGVNPGLGLYNEVLDYYAELHYIDKQGRPFAETVVQHTTNVLARHGLRKVGGEIQSVAGVYIYPVEYFNPLDDATGKLRLTPNTRSIHWYSKTWVNNYGPVRIWITRWLHRIFGVNFFKNLKNLCRK